MMLMAFWAFSGFQFIVEVVFVGSWFSSYRFFPVFGRRCGHHWTSAFHLTYLVGCGFFLFLRVVEFYSWLFFGVRSGFFAFSCRLRRRRGLFFASVAAKKNGFFCWLSFGFFGAVLCSFLAFFFQKNEFGCPWLCQFLVSSSVFLFFF